MILLANQEARSKALRQRNALSKDSIRIYSQQICQLLRPYLIGKIASYRAYGSEVDLSYIEHYPEVISIAYPRTYGEASMEFIPCNETMQYRKGAYGIEEPDEGELWEPEDIDVILVPMVAYDRQLHRVGHGKGYYDRYLKHTKALKIGIAFCVQEVDTIMAQDHDVTMDMIVTEEGILHKG